ncbi:hypothetical protein CYLTODRAFT_445372 [Cylindrobasidium torrendii FP15055 ss-10]|uniref:Uncharacterized protein n=1 Tax=Cylindrobasidium torrendii FP15055 ss-10 TaxID=1314674 RepID=A0A0D7B7A2_9AGAR|nr:hypothetical protein CYLTODRAFT_445372 [Cylindrobasidium torrendii FP15055 ss-10]
MSDPTSFEIKDPATESLTVNTDSTAYTVMNEDTQVEVGSSSIRADSVVPQNGSIKDFPVSRSPQFVLTSLLRDPTPEEMENHRKEREREARIQSQGQIPGLFTTNVPLSATSQDPSPLCTLGTEFLTTSDSASRPHAEGPGSPVSPSGYEEDSDEEDRGYYSDSSVEWKFWDGVNSDGGETVVESVPDSPESNSSTSTDVDPNAIEESELEPLELALFEDSGVRDGVANQDDLEEQAIPEETMSEEVYEPYEHIEIAPVVGVKRSCPSNDEELAPKRKRLITDASESDQASDMGLMQPSTSISAASARPVSVSRHSKRKESFDDAEEPARKRAKQTDLLQAMQEQSSMFTLDFFRVRDERTT